MVHSQISKVLLAVHARGRRVDITVSSQDAHRHRCRPVRTEVTAITHCMSLTASSRLRPTKIIQIIAASLHALSSRLKILWHRFCLPFSVFHAVLCEARWACIVTSIHRSVASKQHMRLQIIEGNHGGYYWTDGKNLECMAPSASQLCQCNVLYCMQWIAKPSWHKLNHQNCAAASQAKMQIKSSQLRDVRCPLWLSLYRAVLLLTHSTQKIDRCACVHALQRVSCLFLRNMPLPEATYLGFSATFYAQSKLLLLPLPVPPLLFQSPVHLIDRGGKRAFIGHEAHLNWLCDTDD